ncbi:hypothetical protein HanXRQr2_Chr01g0023501 [Helianthus annuus]|uniref:Uncharacterized protein n=1 Tax=Helianthus annuus TaxID=4232 RepID=A0A9K3JW38_HELAN|nr:hypothetical protein HanXRQr2_Chr01g0023501 [Helianthus annuus]
MRNTDLGVVMEKRNKTNNDRPKLKKMNPGKGSCRDKEKSRHVVKTP